MVAFRIIALSILGKLPVVGPHSRADVTSPKPSAHGLYLAVGPPGSAVLECCASLAGSTCVGCHAPRTRTQSAILTHRAISENFAVKKMPISYRKPHDYSRAYTQNYFINESLGEATSTCPTKGHMLRKRKLFVGCVDAGPPYRPIPPRAPSTDTVPFTISQRNACARTGFAVPR